MYEKDLTLSKEERERDSTPDNKRVFKLDKNDPRNVEGLRVIIKFETTAHHIVMLRHDLTIMDEECDRGYQNSGRIPKDTVIFINECCDTDDVPERPNVQMQHSDVYGFAYASYPGSFGDMTYRWAIYTCKWYPYTYRKNGKVQLPLKVAVRTPIPVDTEDRTYWGDEFTSHEPFPGREIFKLRYEFQYFGGNNDGRSSSGWELYQLC